MKTVLLLLAMTEMTLADGGVVLAREKTVGQQITVFASPVPLRAGPVDVSVLVQEAKTGRVILDAAVDVAWSASSEGGTHWLPPCCSMNSATGKVNAARGHSRNKLMYSAVVPIKTSGKSELRIGVASASGESSLLKVEIDVQPPRPPLVAYWPCLAFPPLAIAGFALHQRLRHSRTRSYPNKSP